MWYNKFNWTILAFLLLFTLVTGSCLEYGHSCWGAHGKRSGAVPVKQAATYADNLNDQLLNNNNNNVNFMDDDSSNNNNNNNNKVNELPLTGASALSAPREEERNANNEGSKWRQILRQHRYQLRQLQRQFDANDAADSWRRLQQAMAEAEQQQQQQQRVEQPQQVPIGDFFELQK